MSKYITSKVAQRNHRIPAKPPTPINYSYTHTRFSASPLLFYFHDMQHCKAKSRWYFIIRNNSIKLSGGARTEYFFIEQSLRLFHQAHLPRALPLLHFLLRLIYIARFSLGERFFSFRSFY